ncbi:hypothetical protein J2W35_001259 [Variovorax boronicumulans]|uniref:DUF2840 domain-containing protein n=1 Tax=Variovorax boronicumulans TaxID=436515 RepID=UPI00278A9441|nr:DUF2840 domain-containing protein [Variovorax boronicumulans]MDQ0080922.1 hypothetical protein [Variovorax boronicumulans]
MTARDSHANSAIVQTWPQAALPQRSANMQVSLAFIQHRVNVWLRFGRPMRETILDRRRRVATFEPDAVCCRIKWIGNDYGTALWQLMVLQAPMPLDGAQRIAGVQPGARILLRADGEAQVKAVLDVIDGIEALGIDSCALAVTYWRMVGNRLAARQPLPAYTMERHAAHLARGVLR